MSPSEHMHWGHLGLGSLNQVQPETRLVRLGGGCIKTGEGNVAHRLQSWIQLRAVGVGCTATTVYQEVKLCCHHCGSASLMPTSC
jgi:hypothetical protein